MVFARMRTLMCPYAYLIRCVAKLHLSLLEHGPILLRPSVPANTVLVGSYVMLWGSAPLSAGSWCICAPAQVGRTEHSPHRSGCTSRISRLSDRHNGRLAASELKRQIAALEHLISFS